MPRYKGTTLIERERFALNHRLTVGYLYGSKFKTATIEDAMNDASHWRYTQSVVLPSGEIVDNHIAWHYPCPYASNMYFLYFLDIFSKGGITGIFSHLEHEFYGDYIDRLYIGGMLEDIKNYIATHTLDFEGDIEAKYQVIVKWIEAKSRLESSGLVLYDEGLFESDIKKEVEDGFRRAFNISEAEELQTNTSTPTANHHDGAKSAPFELLKRPEGYSGWKMLHVIDRIAEKANIKQANCMALCPGVSKSHVWGLAQVLKREEVITGQPAKVAAFLLNRYNEPTNKYSFHPEINRKSGNLPENAINGALWAEEALWHEDIAIIDKRVPNERRYFKTSRWWEQTGI